MQITKTGMKQIHGRKVEFRYLLQIQIRGLYRLGRQGIWNQRECRETKLPT